MKLIRLKISGIRGFNLEEKIDLDDGLTVIYGQNGQGKTSFVEAIEWLLFGTILKKDKAPSKTEYKDTIKNIHFKNGTPYVEAVFKNGIEQVTLRREYIDEDSSKFFIDGEKSKGISELGLGTAIRPIIYQHGLKSFIHTEPVGRFRQFIKLLNIDTVDHFFVKTRDAQNRYEKNKPQRIQNALLFLNKIKDENRHYYNFLTSNNFDILSLSNKINDELDIMKGNVTEGDFKSFRELVDKKTAEKKKELFDLDIFTPIFEFEPIDSDILDKPEIIESIKILTDPKVRLAKNRLELLKNGLTVIEKTETEECPFCFEQTIDEDKIEYIQKKYQDDYEFEKQIKISQKKIKSYKRQVSQFKATKSEIFKKMVIDKDIINSSIHLGVEKSIIADFNKETDLLNDVIEAIDSDFESLDKLLEKLSLMEIDDEENIINNYLAINKSLKGEFENLNNIVSNLFKMTVKLKTGLKRKISNSETVKSYELIHFIIQNYKNLKFLQLDADIDGLLKTSIREIKNYRDELLKRLLSSHKSKIIEWYNLLNPNEDVCIHDIDCRKDKVNFIASSHGKKIHAVPILSEAHLNCLGLSIYLSKIVNPDNPFSFIFIDDPVQSMDDMHTDNFINEVIGKLLEKDLQVFVFSHMSANVSDLILRRYKDNCPVYFEFYGCNMEGPNIKKKGTTFESYISSAEQNFRGDLEQRKIAANMVRQSLETYVKEYYCKKSGKELPKKCKSAQYSILEKKLLSKVSINSHELGKLRMISVKCDKRSHDDRAFEPPSTPELQSHISTLKGLYRKHIRNVK